MIKKGFDYDKDSDSLIISRKQENENVQGSAEIGDLIIDFTSNGKIANVEFQNISKFLSLMNFDSTILNELTNVELIVQKQRDAIALFAVLQTPKLVQPIPLTTFPVQNSSFIA